MGGPVRVSVVMPSYCRERTIGRSLEALGRQTFPDYETIVVDSSPDDATAEIVRAFPEVRLERSERRLSAHEARNRGAAAARGDLIVFTDPDCAGRPDWLARLVAAYERQGGLVGGAIESAGRGRRERGIHRCKFGSWEAGTAPGVRHMLPTANVLMDRRVWEEVGPFTLLGWSGDTELCWRAREGGHRLAFDPTAVVDHHHEPGLRDFCRERFERGSAFAAMRARAEGWSPMRAAIALIALPVVPFVLLVRGLRDGALDTLAVQLLGHTAWALGEGRAHLAFLLGSRG
jgi:GT2 family glycosyltransferase